MGLAANSVESVERHSSSASLQDTSCPSCASPETSLLLRAPDRFHGRSTWYSLLRCSSCSLVWLADPPGPSEIGQHYGHDYDRAIAIAGEKAHHRWLARRETLVEYKTEGSILDLGCSSGSFLSTLPRERWRLFGIEMSPEVAARAQAASGAQVFVGDILDADFAPASFDAITCFHVFEHLYHPKLIMQRVEYWLKPGGIFYTIMPNIDSAARRVFGSYWFALELPRHLYHFSPASLRNLAHSAGLKVASLETHREVFFEQSSRYVLDDILTRAGFQRPPMAKSSRPGLSFRIVRKAFRLTALPAIDSLIGLAGDKESIHVVFQKEQLPANSHA